MATTVTPAIYTASDDTEYCSETIAVNAHDSKALWSKLAVLLKTPESTSFTEKTADDFAEFFQR